MSGHTDRTEGGGEHHAELTIAELDTERTELLPTRETLTFGNTNWANVFASNSSMALNAASVLAGQQRRRRRSTSPGLTTARGPPAGGRPRRSRPSDPDQHERG